MMHVLMESGARRRPRSAPATAMSVAVHAGIITLAVALTSQATSTDAATAIRDRPAIIYIAPSAARQPARIASAGTPSPFALPVHPEIRLPATLSLPAVPTFDASRLASPNAGEGLSFGPGLRTDLPMGPASDGGAYTTETVDRIAAAFADNPRPVYPQSLRSAGLEGDVVITFVVDTTGRVEPGSLHVVQSAHPLFTEAVRRWLPATRYRPAEIGGRRVRQYVQQQVGFALANER